MIPFQVWLESVLASAKPVSAAMQLRWAWPAAESGHFIGLTLLLGSIAVWDLRLIGFLKGVPVLAFHRLVPFAVAGFLINAATGSLFLMTDPDQYVYNPAFHLKMLWLLLAGANVAVFYLVVFRRVASLDPNEPTPRFARASGAISLALWIGVIICGRMITFYRPAGCAPGEALGWLADCIVGR